MRNSQQKIFAYAKQKQIVFDQNIQIIINFHTKQQTDQSTTLDEIISTLQFLLYLTNGFA